MGPLALADLIGLDVLLSVMGVLHAELGDGQKVSRPCPNLREMVRGGISRSQDWARCLPVSMIEVSDNDNPKYDRHAVSFASRSRIGVMPIDAFQRAILLVDVLRQRGNNCYEQNARETPNVLKFDAELLIDGRTLERPVNYGLARITPPPACRSTTVSVHSSSSIHVPARHPESAV